MQSEAPLTLILSPLRAGRGELKRPRLGYLFGDADTVPPKVPLSLSKRERGFQKSATNRWSEPLSPTLSPLVPRRERERQTSAVVGVSDAPLPNSGGQRW